MSYLKDKLSPSLFVESVPVEVEPWRKALMDAAEYIRVHGHCKGALEDNEGRVCVIGALSKIRCGTRVMLDAATLLTRRLGINGAIIGEWSDATPTHEVLAALYAAARS